MQKDKKTDARPYQASLVNIWKNKFSADSISQFKYPKLYQDDLNIILSFPGYLIHSSNKIDKNEKLKKALRNLINFIRKLKNESRTKSLSTLNTDDLINKTNDESSNILVLDPFKILMISKKMEKIIKDLNFNI